MVRPEDTLLNTNELAVYIRRSPAQIRQMVMRRQIPFRKVCGRLLFLRSEIEAWIEAQPGLTREELLGAAARPARGIPRR